MRVLYSGMVQGVGFRFTAEAVAQRLGVVGWVKNLPDGRVELLCEGDEEVLKGLFSDIKNGTLRNYIRDTDVSWSEATGEFKDFDIRF
ncbi:MAG: acylphosphatase [Candidatus Omnitrophica bacterium]|nr:acylphosphatase [Candidatus Omnitrophota bacterium]